MMKRALDGEGDMMNKERSRRLQIRPDERILLNALTDRITAPERAYNDRLLDELVLVRRSLERLLRAADQSVTPHSALTSDLDGALLHARAVRMDGKILARERAINRGLHQEVALMREALDILLQAVDRIGDRPKQGEMSFQRARTFAKKILSLRTLALRERAMNDLKRRAN